MVAEGVKSAPAVLRLAHEADVGMPICEEVAEVLSGAHSPQRAVEVLMGRDPPATELHGLDSAAP